MLYSVQEFLADYLAHRNLSDPDKYALRLARLYEVRRLVTTAGAFLSAMQHIRTSLFRANRQLQRPEFEQRLLDALDSRFRSMAPPIYPGEFPGGLKAEKKRLASKPLRMGAVLEQFRLAVEDRVVDAFWQSRAQGRLRTRPEAIAQSHLALFLRILLDDQGRGLSFQQAQLGTGFVDLIVVLAKVPHPLELKVQTGKFTGPSQLFDYMRKRARKDGWLVIFDARPAGSRRQTLPVVVTEGRLRAQVVVIDINPVAPSKLKIRR